MNIDNLISRRTALAMQTDIPDMQAYADAWNRLAADFEALGMQANAARCWSRWRHYAGLNVAHSIPVFAAGTYAEFVES